MPRDYQLLLPHTQQLLRIARSGKLGTKRKAAPDLDVEGDDFGSREDDTQAEENAGKASSLDDRVFVAKKWRPTPESALVPEHRHWDFLAKRRNGLPNFYNGLVTEVAPNGIPAIAKRRTRVQKVLDAATGESIIYEVLALEGQVLENELPADSQMPAMAVAPGTTIEGLGTADDEGLINMIPANPPAASRRNRPPPKKKGGPGRGKKRVTFTNPDGSTYTTIVPNATKIVPQPGQTVKHVAKGEEAGKDVSIEEAAKYAKDHPDEPGLEGEHGDDDGDDDDEGDDEGDEDDDREDGEIQDDEQKPSTPAKKASSQPAEEQKPEPQAAEPQDVQMEDAPPASEERLKTQSVERDASSSPEMPLAQGSAAPAPAPAEPAEEAAAKEPSPVKEPSPAKEPSPPKEPSPAKEPSKEPSPAQEPSPAEPQAEQQQQAPNTETEGGEEVAAEQQETANEGGEGEAPTQTFEDGEEDLLGSLERHLEG